MFVIYAAGPAGITFLSSYAYDVLIRPSDCCWMVPPEPGCWGCRPANMGIEEEEL